MAYIRVKNWEKFQHYKDRTPPWIKLHRDLLHDYEFSCLQDASKAHLMLIWLLASQTDNQIPNDPDWVSKQIGSSKKINLKPLIDKGFLVVEQNASAVLADCSSETETDTNNDDYWAREGLQSEWAAFKKMRRSIKAPVNDTAESRLVAKLQRLQADGNDPREVLNRSIENCWKGVHPIEERKRETHQRSN